MAANRLVLLSRTLTDHLTTPTASTFASDESNRHGFAGDEGDILDDLVGPTPTRRRLQRTIQEVDDDDDDDEEVDDGASTCSSVTAGADDQDRRSVSSRGGDGRSVVASMTSISEVGSVAGGRHNKGSKMGSGSANGNGNEPTGRPRRRRRSHRTKALAAVSETASETAYETVSVVDSVSPSVVKGRTSKKTRGHQNGRNDNRKNGPNGQNNNHHRSMSPAPLTRRVRNVAAGAYSREAATTQDSHGRSRRARHPRLIIGLDLDAELELKARLQGDICLTLVMEEKEKMKARPSPELRLKKTRNGNLVAVEDDAEAAEREAESEAESESESESESQDKNEIQDRPLGHINSPNEANQRPGRREICHMRLGRFNLSRRWWMDGFEFLGQFPPPLLVAAVAALPVVGFAAGWTLAQWVCVE